MTLLRTDRPLSVLALDPGEKVGWARARVLPDGTWEELRHGIHALKDMALALSRQITDFDVVIYETWRLYGHKALEQAGSDMQSSQFVGMVRLLCWQHPEIVLVSQGADIKKTADKTAPPELFKLITKPVRHDDGHDQDALRHLYFWTWKNYDVRKPEAVCP